MGKKFLRPLANCVKFHEVNKEDIPRYISKHMDDHPYKDTILPWQQYREFGQPWMKADTIHLQFHAEYSSLQISLIDKDERVWYTGLMDKLLQNVTMPEMYLFQSSLPLAAFPEGIYFIEIKNSNFSLLSEPLTLLNVHKHTLLLEYKHHSYRGGLIFQKGFSPSLRIRATLRLKSLSSKDTFFEDQPLNMSMLDSKPYRVWELRIGGPSGVPDYLADIINRIIGCSTLLIDGKQYTKNDGAKMEEFVQENYPMRGWSIDLREAINRDSAVFENEQLQNGRISIIANGDSRGWGKDTGGNKTQILDLV